MYGALDRTRASTGAGCVSPASFSTIETYWPRWRGALAERPPERLAAASFDGYAGDVPSAEAWEMLSNDPDALLIDVRTRAEWTFVGIPDLGPIGSEAVLLEWRVFPDMGVNAHFQSLLRKSVGDEADRQLFFLCRSGGRSAEAAAAMTAEGYARCFNVADGFEGGLDIERKRGRLNGWKAAGLPWIQS